MEKTIDLSVCLFTIQELIKCGKERREGYLQEAQKKHPELSLDEILNLDDVKRIILRTPTTVEEAIKYAKHQVLSSIHYTYPSMVDFNEITFVDKSKWNDNETEYLVSYEVKCE